MNTKNTRDGAPGPTRTTRFRTLSVEERQNEFIRQGKSLEEANILAARNVGIESQLLAENPNESSIETMFRRQYNLAIKSGDTPEAAAKQAREVVAVNSVALDAFRERERAHRIVKGSRQ